MTDLQKRVLQAVEYINNGLSYRSALSDVDLEQVIKLYATVIANQQAVKQPTKKGKNEQRPATKKVSSADIIQK
jgi:hypothetical protein